MSRRADRPAHRRWFQNRGRSHKRERSQNRRPSRYRTVSLGADDRGRVPFALVGVLLLLSSAAYTGVLVDRDPVADRTAAERALSTTETAAHLAVEQAVLDASTTAAKNPVLTPADTPMGRVLAGDDPFKRYLRLLIYRQVRQSLENVSSTVGETTVRVSLPQVRDPESAREAIRRTHIAPVDHGRRLRVTIQNVTFPIERDGQALGRHRTSLSVVAATPILALHRRTERYERRLDNGPVEGPGMGRRLTGGLMLLTQARGLAQYGKAPISNVLPNRHVELQTNAVALTLQQDAFGTTDPDSTGSLVWAAGRVRIEDYRAVRAERGDDWTQNMLSSLSSAAPDLSETPLSPDQEPARRNVSAKRVADRALVDAVAADGAVDAALEAAYTIDARLVTGTRRVDRTTNTTGTRPADAIQFATSTTTETHVSEAGESVERAVPPGFELVVSDSHRVLQTVRRTTTWQTTTGLVETTETTTTVTLVTVHVATRYRTPGVPKRPVTETPGFERLRAAAVSELLGTTSQRTDLAKRVVAGNVDTDVHRVTTAPPASVRRAARDGVYDVHRQTRNLTGTTDGRGGSASTGEIASTGVTELAAALDANRSRLLDAPARYDGPSGVARTAARSAYLDGVAGQLTVDRSRVAETRGTVQSVLDERDVSIPDVSARPAIPADQPWSRDNGVSVSVTPSYLPVTEVTPQMANVSEPYHPLAARNLNLFTVPSSDVADTVASAVVSEPASTVDVTVAAKTLAASNTDALADNASVVRERRTLRVHVVDATGHLVHSQVRVVTRRTDLDATGSLRLVHGVVKQYPTPVGRALALANDTISRRIATRAARRTDADREMLAAHLRIGVEQARTDAEGRVPRESTEATGSVVREVARDGVKKLVERGVTNASERLKSRHLSESMAELPAGLPVAPIPGSWYATVNVWVVQVRGAYDRVTVRSRVASPTLGSDGLTYQRTAGVVERDVDGDGEAERLGRNERVAFSVTTAVLVVVPPGGQGVGDTDGTMDERSPGWPGPPAAWNDSTAGQNTTQTKPPSIGSP